MIEYSEKELREMISNLRLWKEMKNCNLTNASEICLTKYELLLENHLNNKHKEINKWLNKIKL